MLGKEYFTKKEIIKILKSAGDYSVDSFDDLFNGMFNQDYYIIYAYKAVEALENFKNDEKVDGYKTDLDGVFGAIDLVKQYEIDQFGEVLAIPEDPIKLANMVEYIRGEYLFKEALDKAGLDMDRAVTEKNINKFIEATKEL